MIQILGAILIISATTIIGYHLGNFSYHRKNDLLQFKKASNMLLSEIEHMHTPLKIAGVNITNRLNPPVKNIFITFAELLEAEMPKEAFEKSLKQHKTYLNKDDMYILKEFGSTLGHLDISMQKNAISLLNEQLDIAINECIEIGAKHKKLYTSLGILFGLLINVLLF